LNHRKGTSNSALRKKEGPGKFFQFTRAWGGPKRGLGIFKTISMALVALPGPRKEAMQGGPTVAEVV